MLPVFLLFVWEHFRESFLFTASGFIFHECLERICERQHCCLGNSQDIWNNLMFSCIFFNVNIFPLVEGYKIWMHLSYNNNPNGFGAWILIYQGCTMPDWAILGMILAKFSFLVWKLFVWPSIALENTGWSRKCLKHLWNCGDEQG